MTLPPLAPVSEMERRLGVESGSLEDPDRARAEADLDDASAFVRAKSGRAWVDSGGAITAPPEVVAVTLQAALRSYRNPDGFQGEAVEGYSYQVLSSGATGVYLTADETLIVKTAGTRSGGTGGLVSIATPSAYSTPAAPTADLVYDWTL